MTMTINKKVGQVNMSAELLLAQPAMDALLDTLEKAVVSKMLRKLGSTEGVDAQVALNAWIELYSYNRIRNRLTQAVKMGQSAGKALETVWEQQTDYSIPVNIEERDDGEG